MMRPQPTTVCWLEGMRVARVAAAGFGIAVCIVLGAGAAPSSASSQHVTVVASSGHVTVPLSSQGSGFNLITSAACSAVKGGTAYAVKRLLTSETKSWGAVLGDAVLIGVTHYCPAAVKKGAVAVRAIFRHLTQPSQQLSRSSQQLSRSRYLALFAAQREQQIARQIFFGNRNPSPSYVGRSVDALCSAIRERHSPIPALARFYGNAKLDLLTPLNGVVRLVIRDCPLNSTQASTLTSAILSRLVRDQFRNIDLYPPIVLMETPTETRYSDGNAVVQVHYFRFDSGSGVKTCWIWIGYDGLWHPDGAATYTLAQGTEFNFAVRCEDNAGNFSPWSFSTNYVA